MHLYLHKTRVFSHHIMFIQMSIRRRLKYQRNWRNTVMSNPVRRLEFLMYIFQQKKTKSVDWFSQNGIVWFCELNIHQNAFVEQRHWIWMECIKPNENSCIYPMIEVRFMYEFNLKSICCLLLSFTHGIYSWLRWITRNTNQYKYSKMLYWALIT